MAQGSESIIKKLLWLLPSGLVGRLIGYFLTNDRLDSFFDWIVSSPITIPQIIVAIMVFGIGCKMLFNNRPENKPETLAQATERVAEERADEIADNYFLEKLTEKVGTQRVYTDEAGNTLFTIYFRIGKQQIYGSDYFAYDFRGICAAHGSKLSDLGYCSNPNCQFHQNPVPMHQIKDEINGQLITQYHKMINQANINPIINY